MQLAQVAELARVEKHGGAAPGMEQLGGRPLVGARWRSKLTEAAVEHRLHRVEGPAAGLGRGAGIGDQSQTHRLLRLLRGLVAYAREKHRSDLIHLYLGTTHIVIQGDHVHERGQERGSQCVHLIAQRICDPQRSRRHPQLLEHPPRHEGRVPCLGEPRTGQDLPRSIQAAAHARDRRCPAVVAPPGQRRRDTVVPVDPADLFDQVLRDADVEPEHGRQHVPLPIAKDADVESQLDQDPLRLLEGDVEAEHLVHEPGLQPDPDRNLRMWIDVGPLAVNGAASKLGDHGCRPPGAGEGELGRQALLEPSRRFSTQPESARGLAHARTVEGRGLQKYVCSRIGDGGFLAADDTGDRDRLLGVGDDEHVCRQLAFDAVEAEKLLAGARTAHVHTAARQLGEVECMQRLRVLQQDVVRDVDDVVDRPHAARAQAALDPLLAGTDLHAGDDPADVAAAQVGVVD